MVHTIFLLIQDKDSLQPDKQCFTDAERTAFVVQIVDILVGELERKY